MRRRGLFPPVDLVTGRRLERKGPGRRSTLTGNGRVSLKRERFEWVGKGGLVPADVLVDAAEATVSLGTRKLCSKAAIDSKSFGRGATLLKQVGQLSISTSKLRKVVEDEGKRVLAASESGSLLPGWQAVDCKVKTPEGKEVSRVYLGIDAFTTRQTTETEKCERRKKVVAARAARPKDKPKLPPLLRRKKGADQPYKEMKLVQFHDETLEHRLISVTRKPCEEVARILRRDARRIGFEKADERIANIVGGVWIAALLMQWVVGLSVLCLDFWHLAQQLGQGKRLTFGEKPEGKSWVTNLLHMVKHHGYAPFWECLRAWRGTQPRGPKREEADRLLNYVSSRKEMINYDQCLRRGWRISSSTTESQCGAMPARVKGPGKRWDGDNAEAMIGLEAMHQSNLWEQYWKTCALQQN